ncbi:MAG TPA: FHA domain-containing protein [Kiritimatiellia bacterium]|nr:FHA domain-containing protein [Kiritimatiellia bacterium]
MYRLIFMTGQNRGRRLAIQQGDLVLGSDGSCHVQLGDDPGMAAVHATILHRGEELILQDEAGGETTFVNEHPVKVHRLQHGDVIRLSQTRIEFQWMEPPAPFTPKRKVSLTQVVALAGVAVVLALQALFILGLPFWHGAGGGVELVERIEEPEVAVVEPELEPEPEREVAEEVPKPELGQEERFAAMMEQAEVEMARLRFPQADLLYEEIIAEAPEFLPALVARARLFERRGMNNRALEQWRRVIDRAWGTAFYDEALEAQRKLLFAELDGLDAPRTTPVGRLGRRILISNVERERFQASEEHDELRALRISLRPAVNEASISVPDVKVVVEFFERNMGSDEIVLSTANQGTSLVTLSGAWVPGETRTVTASYMIPKGARERERIETGKRRGYEGYRVLVYYQGDLQDEDASPRRLLDQPRQPAPR